MSRAYEMRLTCLNVVMRPQEARSDKIGEAIGSRKEGEVLYRLFDICEPRADVLKGAIQESDFAADLAQVLRGDAPDEYKVPAKFFANTYPTRGLKNLLCNVCLRLAGHPDQVGAIFRLDTQFGGGKTHSLIALTHAVHGMQGVANPAEFVDPAVLSKTKVRIAAFDGENADPANGRRLTDSLRAFTPWGELAFGLAGEQGFRLVEKSDSTGVAPGADTLRELFGDGPCLILLDELAVYLRKVSGSAAINAGQQLAAFLTSLFKAVESSPSVALVFTLALGKEGKSTDAYGQENQQVASFMAEAQSISARKAALLDPTEEDETVKVLCRRLFERIDAAKAEANVREYKKLWDAQKEALPKVSTQDRRTDEFLSGYPLHPELMTTLTTKTSTLSNFQRVRGMLRLLARTVADLWRSQPDDAYGIHLHHVNPGYEPIRQEIVTRLDQRQLVPAIRAEVATSAGESPALAQELDAQYYSGLPPYGSYVARCVLFHTIAYQDTLRGITPEELRYSILSPGTDISFIDDARKRFVADSAYLDDRPNVPLRFLAEPNLTQMIRRQEQNIDPSETRVQLNDKIREIFGGSILNLVPFASGPHDVPDDGAESRPALVLLSYDAASVQPDAVVVPELVERTFLHKGSGNDWRHTRNNLLFLVADASGKLTMQSAMTRKLALEVLRTPEKLRELAEYQVNKLNEYHERSKQQLALAIQQSYRHIFYPSRNKVDGTNCELAHTVIDVQTASDRPGDGQKQVVTQLQNIGKLRVSGDSPDSPTYVRDRTPLKKGQITTAGLRNEFRQDVSLPMLVGDDVFLRGIRLGIDTGEYVYQSGELLLGKGDPFAEIKIDEQSLIFTSAYAREHNIWPRSQQTQAKTSPDADDAKHIKPDTPFPSPPPATDVPAKEPNAIVAEDVLRSALTEVFEKAQRAKVKSFAKLTIRPFDHTDTLRLLSAINSVSNATKRVQLKIEYETADNSVTELSFNGTVTEAVPLKDFVDAQFRVAKDKNCHSTFELQFSPPFVIEGDNQKKLVERLARVAPGAAEVIAMPTQE